ncbi:MAG: tyrosine-type recombinase/integrase [Planctomycetes bacterium]|nr:tyrosine-type recombinase/integrase [Planctomycetota bacterium]
MIADTSAAGFSHTLIETVGNFTAATYYDNVQVPANRLVGQLHGGWKLVTSQLNHERLGLGSWSDKVFGPFSKVLAWAKARKHVTENPLHELTFTAPPPKDRDVLSLERVNQILAAASERLVPILSVLAFTGARSGEVERLLVEDVDLVNGWIKIVSREGKETKTGRSRKVPIHPRLHAVLSRYRKPKSGYFFTAEPSKRYPDGAHHINPKHLNEFFLKMLKKLKIPTGRVDGFTIHSLRHFMRTFAVNSGVPERAVDLWLGHATDRRTVQSVYYHLSDEASQQFMSNIPFGEGRPAADAGE